MSDRDAFVLTPEIIAEYEAKMRRARAIADPAIDGLIAQWIAGDAAADKTGASMVRAICISLGQCIMRRPMDVPPEVALDLMLHALFEGMRSVDATAFDVQPATLARPH